MDTNENLEFPSPRTAILAEFLTSVGYPPERMKNLALSVPHMREDELYDLMRFIARHFQRQPD